MIDLTIHEALEKLKSGEISATELTRAYLDRIEKYGDKLKNKLLRALQNVHWRMPPRRMRAIKMVLHVHWTVFQSV